MRKLAMVMLLGCALAAWSQERPAVSAQQNTVYVSAEGKYEAAPDTALVQFNIAAQEDTAKGAYERGSRAAEQVRQILRSAGVDPKQAEIGFFSLQPIYDWHTPKHKVVAYQVSASVSLKLSNLAKIAPIVQQLADSDVTDNESVSYTLENMDEAKQRAVEDAYRRARQSAETVARAGQRSLAELLYASVDTFEPVRILGPAVRGAVRMGVAQQEVPPTAEFSPQKISISAHVNAMFGIK